jgi:hypothetical protein
MKLVTKLMFISETMKRAMKIARELALCLDTRVVTDSYDALIAVSCGMETLSAFGIRNKTNRCFHMFNIIIFL